LVGTTAFNDERRIVFLELKDHVLMREFRRWVATPVAA
jgi:hypothetical protein